MTKRLPRYRYVPTKPAAPSTRWTGAEFKARLWQINRSSVRDLPPERRRKP
jgi:hypothetical protein